LDVEIKKQPVGRIEMVLFSDVSPRAAENFR
jgi:cyclophilin family peptidyl-prolyl cis-trans isomerase